MNKKNFKVGELLYREYLLESGEVGSSLFFIDEEPIEGIRQFMYTEIALIGDFDNGMEIYLGIEAGGIPSDLEMRKATDQDIRKFIDYIKKCKVSDYPSPDQWIKSITDDRYLLKEEKERIKSLLNE